MHDLDESVTDASRLAAAAQPFARRVRCRCGQTFTVYVGARVARVSCHQCGHKMLVKPNGDAVDLPLAEPTRWRSDEAMPAETGICEVPPRKASEHIQSPPGPDARPRAAATAEAQWRIEQLQKSMAEDVGWPGFLCRHIYVIALLLLFLLYLVVWLMTWDVSDGWFLVAGGLTCVKVVLQYNYYSFSLDRWRGQSGDTSS